MLLVHHGAPYFKDVPILALDYTVLLRSVSASEFSPNSFLSEIRRKIFQEILLASIQSKASYMSTNRLFDFAFEFLEVSEHFTLLPHWVDPSVPGVVVDEEHVVSASTECSHLSRYPYVGMDYVE